MLNALTVTHLATSRPPLFAHGWLIHQMKQTHLESFNPRPTFLGLYRLRQWSNPHAHAETTTSRVDVPWPINATCPRRTGHATATVHTKTTPQRSAKPMIFPRQHLPPQPHQWLTTRRGRQVHAAVGTGIATVWRATSLPFNSAPLKQSETFPRSNRSS